MTASPRVPGGLLIAAAALSLLGAPGADAAARGPKDLVRQLYAEPTSTLDTAKAARYFAADLDPGLVGGTFNFDVRYGAHDLDITGLQLLEEIDNDQAKVVAVFKNFGHPESVDWMLCRRSDGAWRISDASSNSDRASWDLRDMLRLGSGPVKC